MLKISKREENLSKNFGVGKNKSGERFSKKKGEPNFSSQI